MCKEIVVDTLAEKLLAIGPIMSKKIIRLDMSCNETIPINQLMVLGALHEHGSLSISEICKRLFISKPQMTIIVDKLAKSELVYRIHNNNDRRIINISLTEKGNEYCQNLLETFKKDLRHKLITLSKDDLITLLNSVEITESILKRLE